MVFLPRESVLAFVKKVMTLNHLLSSYDWYTYFGFISTSCRSSWCGKRWRSKKPIGICQGASSLKIRKKMSHKLKQMVGVRVIYINITCGYKQEHVLVCLYKSNLHMIIIMFIVTKHAWVHHESYHISITFWGYDKTQSLGLKLVEVIILICV